MSTERAAPAQDAPVAFDIEQLTSGGWRSVALHREIPPHVADSMRLNAGRVVWYPSSFRAVPLYIAERSAVPSDALREAYIAGANGVRCATNCCQWATNDRIQAYAETYAREAAPAAVRPRCSAIHASGAQCALRMGHESYHILPDLLVDRSGWLVAPAVRPVDGGAQPQEPETA